MKNKRKLKIIKYNQKILERLNITKEDYEVYKSLKEFNEKYKTNIDFDCEQVRISGMKIEKDGLELLSKLKYVKRLHLYWNQLLDINIISKFENLIKLVIGENGITNIDILDNDNFKNLKVLDLSGNCISNINLLEKVYRIRRIIFE